MTTLDGQDLFSSGPSTLAAGPWERQFERRGFPGLDGQLVLDMGLRSRRLEQAGRLQADTPAELYQQVSAIQAMADGAIHSLCDNNGQQYPKVYIEQFELAGPVRRGRGFWADYRIVYRQMP
ncbi:MAG: hypothetical protein HZA50_04465 [Planctomycetes bacterium]|nr:hypothetical protein [Planctomycetota bacterium]